MCGARLVARRAGHQRRRDESAAIDRVAGRVHRRWPNEALGVPSFRHRRFLAGISRWHDAGEPCAAPGRRRKPMRRQNGNGATPASVPHLVVMFFAEPGQLASFVQSAKGAGWNERSKRCTGCEPPDLDGVEPFGFADGISQPQIDWERRNEMSPRRNSITATSSRSASFCSVTLTSTTNTPIGRCSIPMRPERGVARGGRCAGQKRSRPQRNLSRHAPAAPGRARASGSSSMNGSGGNATEADKLAAAFVGRTRAGDPLVPMQEQTDSRHRPRSGAGPQNQFTFAEDRTARVVRLARTSIAPIRATPIIPGRPTGLAKLITMLGFGPNGFRDDLMSPVRFHRILRAAASTVPGCNRRTRSRRPA